MCAKQIGTITVRAVGAAPVFHHLTAVPRRPLVDREDLTRFMAEIVEEIARRELDVLYERLFCRADAAAELSAARATALDAHGRTPEAPSTVACHRPCIGGSVAGLQLLGVSGAAAAGGRVRTLYHRGDPVGRELTAHGRRMVFFPDVHADPAAGAGDAAVQVGGMFERARRLLDAHGLHLADVARTWLYVDPLLAWYDELNRVRDGYYRDAGLLPPGGGRPLPASTGIQGGHPTGVGCFMDLLAVEGTDGGAPAFSPLRSPMQCEAASYGASFSRGMQVDLVDHQLVLISGTASIDPDGHTLCVGDPEGQLRVTYDLLRSLLAQTEGGVGDVVSAVLFFKEERVYRTWRRLRTAGALPPLPGVAVYADVCRDELLFEIEPNAAR